MTDDQWAANFDKLPVTGDCDAGCGRPATTWFGMTSCAHCGDVVCHATLQVRYNEFVQRQVDQEEDPFLLRATIAGLEAGTDALRQKNAWQATKIIEQARELNVAAARIGMLEAALIENHEWHKRYDEHDGYGESGLEQTNLAALRSHYSPDLDQRVADWHEGRTESGRTLHDFAYVSNPNSSANKNMLDLDKHLTDIPERSPVHNALRVHLDHLLNNLLPICHGEGPAQVLAASLVTVQTLRDLGLIDPAEVQTLTAHVRAVCEAHDPELKAFFNDIQPPE